MGDRAMDTPSAAQSRRGGSQMRGLESVPAVDMVRLRTQLEVVAHGSSGAGGMQGLKPLLRTYSLAGRVYTRHSGAAPHAPIERCHV
jgi:hypothetical protein